MILNIDKNCSIVFGNAALFPISFKEEALFNKFCNTLRNNLGLDTLIFNKQIHGINGKIVTPKKPYGTQINLHDDDWHATQTPYVGLGVLTADCLPIIFYEPKKRVIAAAHAGWKGSMQGIIHMVLETLKSLTPYTPKIFFGPSAHNCCYEVKDDFITNIEKTTHGLKCVTKRDNKLFFDNILYNKHQLDELGVQADKIDTQHSLCTICNHQFHSYRRSEDKIAYKAQGTIIWLKG